MSDPQIDFIQVWAVPCQAAIDWYIDVRDRYGDERAKQIWVDHCIEIMERDRLIINLDQTQELAMDLCHVATMYIDLMIRFGVFDGDTTN